jgi:ABC-type phosphate/phosphonate transport system permease subunit
MNHTEFGQIVTGLAIAILATILNYLEGNTAGLALGFFTLFAGYFMNFIQVVWEEIPESEQPKHLRKLLVTSDITIVAILISVLASVTILLI